MKRVTILLAFLFTIISSINTHALPVVMQKMVCYPVDVSIINSYDKDEILKKSTIVYTNEKIKSDIILYRCEMNDEICYMKLQNNNLTTMSCFKGF